MKNIDCCTFNGICYCLYGPVGGSKRIWKDKEEAEEETAAAKVERIP